MSFCTACGCERIGANLYCDGCGGEFGEPEPPEDHGANLARPYVPAHPALLAEPALPAQLHPGSWASGFSAPWSFTGASDPSPSGPVTRPDVGIGLLDSLLVPPDPGGEVWSDVGTADAEVRHRPRGRLRWLAVAAAAVVIIAGLGGAAAYELRHGHGRPALLPGSAAAEARAPRSAPASASGPSGDGGASVTVAVAVSSAVARNATVSQVIALLDRYFSAINAHDYAAYTRLLDPQALARSPASAFYAGDGSTTDSGETLTGLADASAGMAAAVTFTSHQQPADSPDHRDCDAWSITLYLVPQGGGYLIGLPPPGYQASFASC
jgi:hypothetical protein